MGVEREIALPDNGTDLRNYRKMTLKLHFAEKLNY